MSKKKIFHVYCDVYGTNLLVMIGVKKEEVRPYLEKKFKIKWDYEEAKNGGVAVFDKWPFHVLWIDENITKMKGELIPKLAHEVLHHVGRVCANKGIPTYPEIDNLIMDEAKCYLMEFYMREILKKLK